MTYSLDFRRKVLRVREKKGLSMKEAAERFDVGIAIECFFGKIKENKRLALRFDKLDFTFLAFFHLACMKVLNLLC